MNNRHSRLLGFVVYAMMATLARAQTEPRIIETTLTVLRVSEQNQDYIGNRAVLGADVLKALSATHIQQALVHIPGLDFHHNSGQEYLPAVRSPVLTGAGACGSFLMAEDGIPLRPAGFCNVNELFEAHSEIAQRIEVVRGPSSALYGSNALHGVVNIITPAVADAVNRISIEAGANDYYRLVGGLTQGDFAVFFSGSSDAGFRDNSGVDQQKLTLRHDYAGAKYDVSSGITAVNLNQESAGFISGKDAYKNTQLVSSNPNPEAYRDAQAVRAWSRIGNSDERQSWLLTPYLRYSEMAFLQHFLPGTPLEQNAQWSLGVQSIQVAEFGRNTLSWGLDAEYFQGKLHQRQDQPTEGSAFLQATIPVGDHYDYRVNGYQLAPFVHWHRDITDTVSLTLGGRAEWLQYDYDNKMLSGRLTQDGSACGFGGCRYSRPEDSQDGFFNLSPKFAVNYQLSPQQALFMTLARGFRVPQTVELYRLERAQTGADLKSEQVDSAELGWRGRGQRYTAELVLYAMNKRNVIYRDSDFFNIDAGRTQHRGLELGFDYALSQSLSVGLSASYARHTYARQQLSAGVDIDGNDVDTAPRHFGSALLKWQPTTAVDWQLEWLHTGAYFTDPENQHRYDGHDLLNLRGGLRLSDSVELSVKITNVMDRHYAERADFTSFSGDRYLPGEARQFYLGLALQW